MNFKSYGLVLDIVITYFVCRIADPVPDPVLKKRGSGSGFSVWQ